jgi:hypothetical protein
MLDPLAQQVGIGGAVAVLLVSAVMKFLPAFMAALKHQNGKFTEYQKLQVIEIVRLTTEETRIANESALADLRKLITDRTDTLRGVIRDEIGRHVK